MARKRPQRGAYPSRIANGFVQYQHLSLDDLIRPLPSLLINPLVRSSLSEVEDHRYWHPDPVPIARGLRNVARTEEQLAPRRRSSGPTRPLKSIHAITFRAPKFVAVCVRRNARKEVLHALKRTGKAGSFKKPRRNYWSNVRC